MKEGHNEGGTVQSKDSRPLYWSLQIRTTYGLNTDFNLLFGSGIKKLNFIVIVRKL